jgi:chromosomal replication initiation ATPase DnaA
MNNQESQRSSEIHLFDEIPPAVRLIQKRVADAWDIPVSEMSARTRGPHVDDPRAVAMMLCRELVREIDLGRVAAYFARRCKGSVILAAKTARDHIDVEPAFAEKVRRVRQVIEDDLHALLGRPPVARAG